MHDDYTPFEYVTLKRVLDETDQVTEWVDLKGLRGGREYTRRVRYEDLLDQADVHLRLHHAKSLNDPSDVDELAHATIRAAVVLLTE